MFCSLLWYFKILYKSCFEDIIGVSSSTETLTFFIYSINYIQIYNFSYLIFSKISEIFNNSTKILKVVLKKFHSKNFESQLKTDRNFFIHMNFKEIAYDNPFNPRSQGD